jgi:lysine 2,3-aminomutase
MLEMRIQQSKQLDQTDSSNASHTQYVTDVTHLEQLTDQERTELLQVTRKFPFRCNRYFLSLISWDDANDPIRKIVIPDRRELVEWGRLDPSDEKTYTVMPGLQHKYDATVLLLVTNLCDGICRFCFRKRFFLKSQRNYIQDLPAALRYIKEHREITNVLLTGGDPLVLTNSKLGNILCKLREIDHVQIIRIGTKIPAFNPHRVVNDPDLLDMIRTYSTEQKKIYVMTHFVHPRELTDMAIKAVHLLQRAGAVVANQAPLIRDLNDDPEVMAELLRKLSFVGAVPYYIFQCRPAVGNKAYTVPIEQGYDIVEQAKARVSGLAKRARFVMSHATGKIEVVGKTSDLVYFRYHSAHHAADSGRLMAFKSNPNANWLEDYDQQWY